MNYKPNSAPPNKIIIKEGQFWFLSLLENQYYLGRATLILKDFSIKHLNELTEKQILELFSFIKKYEIALKKSFNTTNFNWTCLMNNSYKKENLKKQYPLHFHVWPRYKDVVVFNKEKFHDEVFAHHYDKYKEKKVSKEFLEKLAERILSNWED
jgi:diadenosine tetraphosphate (Ap4A) HIT family hydrolase